VKTKTPGLIELDCGWYIVVTAAAPLVRMVLQFDPAKEMPEHGIKVLRLSVTEATEIRDAFNEAIDHCEKEQAWWRGGRRSRRW
jgi:hypothetical protein